MFIFLNICCNSFIVYLGLTIFLLLIKIDFFLCSSLISIDNFETSKNGNSISSFVQRKVILDKFYLFDDVIEICNKYENKLRNKIIELKDLDQIAEKLSIEDLEKLINQAKELQKLNIWKFHKIFNDIELKINQDYEIHDAIFDGFYAYLRDDFSILSKLHRNVLNGSQKKILIHIANILMKSFSFFENYNFFLKDNINVDKSDKIVNALKDVKMKEVSTYLPAFEIAIKCDRRKKSEAACKLAFWAALYIHRLNNIIKQTENDDFGEKLIILINMLKLTLSTKLSIKNNEYTKDILLQRNSKQSPTENSKVLERPTSFPAQSKENLLLNDFVDSLKEPGYLSSNDNDIIGKLVKQLMENANKEKNNDKSDAQSDGSVDQNGQPRKLFIETICVKNIKILENGKNKDASITVSKSVPEKAQISVLSYEQEKSTLMNKENLILANQDHSVSVDENISIGNDQESSIAKNYTFFDDPKNNNTNNQTDLSSPSQINSTSEDNAESISNDLNNLEHVDEEKLSLSDQILSVLDSSKNLVKQNKRYSMITNKDNSNNSEQEECKINNSSNSTEPFNQNKHSTLISVENSRTSTQNDFDSFQNEHDIHNNENTEITVRVTPFAVKNDNFQNALHQSILHEDKNIQKTSRKITIDDNQENKTKASANEFIREKKTNNLPSNQVVPSEKSDNKMYDSTITKIEDVMFLILKIFIVICILFACISLGIYLYFFVILK